MKKLIKGLLGLAAIGGALFFIVPTLIFSTGVGQQFYLWLADAPVASFSFKDRTTSPNTVYMNGVIYASTLNDLQALLSENPNINKIVMEDVPGSFDDEVNLLASRLIREKGIATHIPKDGMVASGGTDMFLAGSKRTIEVGAKLGVHSWANETKTAREYGKDDVVHELYLKYYREMNIDQSFYWYTLDAASADDIYWMTPADIVKYQVVTEPFDQQVLVEVLK